MTLDPTWSRRREYPVVDGAIVTHSLEAHVTDHCNLRCAGCCVLSPLAARRFVTPAELARDLALARQVLRPSVFKLTGGEPLLAPEIVSLARVAKESGIAPKISLTTNGVLLGRAPDALFEALDAITLSIYPGVGLAAGDLEAIRERAARFGVALDEKVQDEFQSMTRRTPETDAKVTRRVFDTCWLRHRCHTVRDGVLFACSRVPGTKLLPQASPAPHTEDGVSLAPRAELARDVRLYLERHEPLVSCTHCRGGTGAFFPFRQLTRSEVRERSPE
jgi:hypothetical protein